MRSIKNMKSGGSSLGNDDELLRGADYLKNKYADKSETELTQELFRKVYAAKSDGTFSSEQIDEFVKMISPNLDDAQKKRLNELVRMIKGG